MFFENAKITKCEAAFHANEVIFATKTMILLNVVTQLVNIWKYFMAPETLIHFPFYFYKPQNKQNVENERKLFDIKILQNSMLLEQISIILIMKNKLRTC